MEKEFSNFASAQPEICFRATLRIFGNIENPAEITNALNLQPTYIHRKGERSALSTPYEHDMWSLTAPLGSEEALEKHLAWLKEKLIPHKNYIQKLTETCTVDIFCGYRTDSDQGGFELSPHVLSLFVDLGIPMCVSIIIA
jgi:hypothetical protein